MTRSAEAQAREQEEQDEHAVLIALVLLLLAGLPFPILSGRIIRLMATVGITATATAGVLALIGSGGLVFAGIAGGDGMGPAESMMRRSAVGRRARYIVAASKRLNAGGSIEAERALYRAHLAAEERRVKAARVIDDAAQRFGPVLGWHAVRDGRTTKECFASHGGNFSALRPPSVGWPGTLHGGNCRCRPVAPWPGGDMLP